jgi:hypothetical protein
MTEKNEKSVDHLGVAPYGEALNTVAKGAMAGAGAFLGRICLPAAEEFGLLLREKVAGWRTKNITQIANKAEEILSSASKEKDLHAHPRLVGKVMNEGSWADDEKVQDMWAGLLASSCTKDGRDETNLIFMNLLSQITSVQARILNHACESSKKKVSPAGWLNADYLQIELKQLQELVAINDFHRLDRELDHLRTLGLIQGGFDPCSTLALITPTALALQMYVRCQGFTGSPVTYFGLEEKL